MVPRSASLFVVVLMTAGYANAQVPVTPKTDALGDLLPPGAVARLG
jgi:hypothetical protein